MSFSKKIEAADLCQADHLHIGMDHYAEVLDVRYSDLLDGSGARLLEVEVSGKVEDYTMTVAQSLPVQIRSSH